MDRDAESIESMVRSIREHMLQATDTEYRDGLAWYSIATDTIRESADSLGIEWRKLAGAVAATSPGMPWGRNLAAAIRCAENVGNDRSAWRFPTRSGRDTIRALDILGGSHPSILGSMKTRRFYRNLCGNLQAVTVDRWAIRAAGIDADSVTDRQYRHASIAYTRVAAEFGIAPAQLQAIVWIVVRRIAGYVD